MHPAVRFSAGGTVQASGGIYISRPADEELFCLCMEGRYANVLTSRQMGKSSLRVAVSERLRREGIRTASIDLTSIGTQASAEQWYVSFLETVESKMRLDTGVLDWWEAHQHLTPTDRFARYFLDVALAEIHGRVVIFVDEIDSTLSLPFGADDFFAAIRSLFNARAEVADARRLSFVLIGSAAPGDLIRSSSRTPFNIGHGLALTDFSEESAQPLAGAFASGIEERRELLQRVFLWTAGHPYLTQRLSQAVSLDVETAKADFETVVRQTFFAAGTVPDSNLEWVRDMLTERAPDREAVLTIWRDVLRGRRVRDEETSVAKSHLKLTGVVRPEKGNLKPRNRLYATAFNEAWVLRHLPQDVERQRRLARYKRIAAIAAGVATVLAVVGIAMGLLVRRARLAESVATRERDSARSAQTKAISEQRRAEAALSAAEIQRAAAEAAKRQAQAQSAAAEAAKREAETQRSAAQKEQQRAEAAAREAQARQIAAQSQYLSVRPGQLTLAGLLGVESLRRLPLLDNRNAVAAALDLTPHARARLNHQQAVTAAAISPDARWLATVSGWGNDRAVSIWDAGTGKERVRLVDAHGLFADYSRAVAFSRDGKWLAASSFQNTVSIWDSATGRERARFVHRTNVVAAVISPDGAWLATAARDKAVHIWDAASGQERTTLPYKAVPNTLAISPDGAWLAIAGGSENMRIWDARTGRQRTLSSSVYEAVLAISADGKWLACNNSENTVSIWDVASGREHTRLGDPNWLIDVAISPDGNWAATGSMDNTARIWDIATGRERFRLEHRDRVVTLAISPDSKLLATGSWDNTARLWEAGTGRECARVEHVDLVEKVAISPDGKWFATTSRDKTAGIWETDTGRERTRLDRIGVRCTVQTPCRKLVAISPDGTWIATATNTITRMWDARTGRQRASVYDGASVSSVAIGPDSQWLATVSGKTLRVWNASTGRERGHLTIDQGISAMAVSAGGKLLAAGLYDNTARIWDVDTGRERTRFKDLGVFNAVAFSPDGKWVATANGSSMGNGFDKRTRLWDVETGRELAHFEHPDVVNAVAISPDGKWLASASDDKTVRICDAASGRERARLDHQSMVKAVAISPDGKWLASGSDDNTVRIWDAATLAPYIRLQFGELPEEISFLPDKRLLLVTHGSTVTLEPWQGEDLVQDLCHRVTRNLTLAEWAEYLGQEPYRRTCPNLSGAEAVNRMTAQ